MVPTQVRRCCAVLLLCGGTMSAQSAATVPPDSRLYDRLEAISAFFPAKGVFLGERPSSVREFAVAIRTLSERVDLSHESERQRWARRELAALRAALPGAEGAVHSEPVIVSAYRASI